jgi:hypothetical protein
LNCAGCQDCSFLFKKDRQDNDLGLALQAMEVSGETSRRTLSVIINQKYNPMHIGETHFRQPAIGSIQRLNVFSSP